MLKETGGAINNKLKLMIINLTLDNRKHPQIKTTKKVKLVS